VNFSRSLPICAFLCCIAPTTLNASADVTTPAATSFAYPVSHPVKPLPDAAIEQTIAKESPPDDEALAYGPPGPIEVHVEPPPLTRSGVCSAVASAARANGLPVPFFANLIWQESSFNAKVVSPAGAQGIAQFMPKTAVAFGLMNPFEPVQALHAAGRFLRELRAQFGNLGLAAAAYNAGPGRVMDWMTKRKTLPGETRNYVLRITGRPADHWTSREKIRHDPAARLMPARAPCTEVAEAVAHQTRAVRVSRLMSELTDATSPSRPVVASKAKEAPRHVAHAKTHTKHGARTHHRVAHASPKVPHQKRPRPLLAARPAARPAKTVAAHSATPATVKLARHHPAPGNATRAGAAANPKKVAVSGSKRPAVAQSRPSQRRTRMASAP
jgi:hypothetical protein